MLFRLVPLSANSFTVMALKLMVIFPFLADQDIIEGDIVMDSQLKEIVEYAIGNKRGDHIRQRRDTITYQQMRWKDAVIPYVIDASVGMYFIHYV